MLTLLDGQVRASLRGIAVWLLMPALLLGFVAWFAIRGERAAVERELTTLQAKEAQDVPVRIDALLRADAAAYLAGRSVASPVADYAVLNAAAELVEPRQLLPVTAPRASASLLVVGARECEALVTAYRAAIGAGRSAVFARLVQACPTVRAASGRALLPTALLADPDVASAQALLDWMYQYGELLGSAERADMATTLEITQFSRTDKQRLRAELNGADLTLTVVRELFERDEVQRAARALAPGATRLDVFDRARVAIARLPDGTFRASAATSASLARPAAMLALHFAPEVTATLSSPGEPLRPAMTQVQIAPNLTVVVALVEGAAKARTLRSRALLAVASLALVGFLLLLVIRAERQARRATVLSELRVDFGAAVAHELRTPTASLSMLAELLAGGKVEAVDLDAVYKSMATESSRLRLALERMLALRRMATAGAKAVRTPVDLAQLIREHIANRSDHSVISADLVVGTCDVDGELVRTALDNLPENASKYGKPPVRVTLTYLPRCAELAVFDHGTPISAANQRRIFQPFDRGDADRVASGVSGLGIGLALVDWCARAHGGRVHVTSTADGNLFTLKLPLPRAVQ